MNKNSNVIYISETISQIEKIQKKYLGKKYHVRNKSFKNKKRNKTNTVKVLSTLAQLEKKYPENWGYGFRTLQGGSVGSRR